MILLDKKERVFDVELTQHGKRLLLDGKLNPAFYAFFDDDINYNSDVLQNDTEVRILELTPILSAQSAFSSIEDDIKSALIKRNYKDKESIKIIPTIDNMYSMNSPLGNMENGSAFAPAIHLKMLHGEISGSINYLSGNFYSQKIPQINITLPYEIVKTKDVTFGNNKGDGDTNIEGIIDSIELDEDEDTFVSVLNNYILISLEEKNQIDEKENFEIEAYEVLSYNNVSSVAQEFLKPLFFDKKISNIINDILVDENFEEQEQNVDNPNMASTFFNVLVDNEIPENILCKIIEKKKNIFLDPNKNICKQEKKEENNYNIDIGEINTKC